MLAGGAQNATPLLRCFDPHVLSNYRYVTYAFELGRLALPVGEGLAEMTRSHNQAEASLNYTMVACILLGQQ